MRKPTKQSPETDRSPKKRRDMPQATDNKRLAEQIRKILGKHYATNIGPGKIRLSVFDGRFRETEITKKQP